LYDGSQKGTAAAFFIFPARRMAFAALAKHELLGDLLIRKGQTEQAASSFRMAYQLDSKLGKGATLEAYVAARMKVN
jgi:predicted negative regulator of RcsB-dependent stress response